MSQLGGDHRHYAEMYSYWRCEMNPPSQCDWMLNFFENLLSTFCSVILRVCMNQQQAEMFFYWRGESVRRNNLVNVIGQSVCEDMLIMWLKSSWDMVKAGTISICFRECGFKHQIDSADQDVQSDIQILHDLQPEEQFESVLGEMSLDAYNAIDCDVITISMPVESKVQEAVESENDLNTETDPLQFCPKAANDMLKAMIREALANGKNTSRAGIERNQEKSSY